MAPDSHSNGASLRIAFVKQDVYQDLYVNSSRCTPAELLFSSIMRVGPIGLFTRLNADFHIIREDAASECSLWKKTMPGYKSEWFHELQHKPITQTGFPEAVFLQPGSALSHSDFSVSAGDIDWSSYDVVISVNLSIPTRIVQQHPQVLWCYMMGEASVSIQLHPQGYDVRLNQETRGIITDTTGELDFPYTFVGPDCLEKLMESAMARPSRRQGIYLEVNSSDERPVKTVPVHLQPLLVLGHPLRLHHQNIRANLEELFDSKYFVKIGGREIRGNSVIEAISSGAVVLMNPSEIYHAQLLPPESWVHSIDETLSVIERLEKHPQEWEALRQAQRERVRQFVFEAPLRSLRNAVLHKRQTPRPAVTSLTHRFFSKIKRLTGLHSR